MKLVFISFFLAFLAVVYASGSHTAVGENVVPHVQPDQVVNPADWHGSWTAKNRYGGVMYTCPKGDVLYGIYSNAGFLIGTINDRVVEGNWYEGGRGARNFYQGSFKITISDDNQEFDGFFNRVALGQGPFRWHETRLGAPEPANPTWEECFAPDDSVENLLGSYYRSSETGALSGSYFICEDEWNQIYGSFHQPDGYLSGWSVQDATGFHGYRYDSNGQSGAYILRALTRDRVKGFYWRGRVAEQNIGTTSWEALYRNGFTATLNQCEQVGPGFNERLRGPRMEDNSASTLQLAVFALIAMVLALF